MKVAVADVGACQKTLTIEVAPEVVAAARDAVERQLQRASHVPGFRVGHAPRELVARRYADHARAETIRRVVGEQLPRALQEAHLDVLGDPEVTQVSLDDGRPTFTVRCEVMPVIPLRNVRGLRIKRPAVAVTDDQVDAVLGQLQERHAELVPVEPRPLAAGEYAVVDFTCTVEGKVVEQRTGAVVYLKPEEDANGMSRHLVGTTPSPEAITFEATLPQDLSAKAYAGKPAIFAVTVRAVKVKQVPLLDEAFAKLLGVETVDALRARVRQDLAQELTAQARRAAEEQVIRQLAERTPFEVPVSLVQSQAQRLLRDAQLRLVYQGAAPDDVAARRPLLADDSKRDALHQVKAFFLLRQVAKEQQLMATPAEVEQRLQTIAARSQRTVEAVRADLQQQQLLGELTWDITRGKVMDYLLAQATIQQEEKPA